MSLMKDFQKKKKEDPGYGETKSSFSVLGAMPTSPIRKQQVMNGLDKELKEDLARLKLVKSIKQKEKEKEEHLVPKYLPAVKGLMASGSDDPLIGQILVWLFDIKDIHTAMELASYCIEKQVAMPEFFKRDLPTYLCDTIVDWAEREHEDDRSCEPYFSKLCELSEGWDVPDQVRAKIYRLKGLIALDAEDYETALKELENAEEYGAKVKTKLSKVKKALEK